MKKNQKLLLLILFFSILLLVESQRGGGGGRSGGGRSSSSSRSSRGSAGPKGLSVAALMIILIIPISIIPVGLFFLIVRWYSWKRLKKVVESWTKEFPCENCPVNESVEYHGFYIEGSKYYYMDMFQMKIEGDKYSAKGKDTVGGYYIQGERRSNNTIKLNKTYLPSGAHPDERSRKVKILLSPIKFEDSPHPALLGRFIGGSYGVVPLSS